MRLQKENLRLDLDADWRQYANAIPAGAKGIAVATLLDTGVTGALLLLRGGGYLFVAPSRVEQLDGRVVTAILGRSGRPATIAEPKRVALYLDAVSVSLAKALGAGNVSKGVRAALALAGNQAKSH